MNTITRLSGWSSSAAAAGAANGGDGSPSRRSSSTTRQQQQQEERNGSSLNDSVPLSSRSAASIDAMPSSSRAPNTSNPKLPACSSNVTNDLGDGSRAEAAGDGARGSPESVLKPPEAVLHEELEAAGAATCTAAGSSSEARAAAASAAAYPSPPPTPPLPERQDAMGASDVSAQTEELLTGHVPSGEKIGRKDGAEPLYLRPDKLHTASTSLTASSPGVLALAQAYPIKCLTRLYMLIRRFLALFGIRVDDSDTQQHSMSQPTAASIVPATQPGLPPRPSRDAPPSYADATADGGGSFISTDTSSENHNGSLLPPAAAAGQKRPRWRFPGLSVPMVGKRRRPSFPTTDSMSSSRNGEDEGEPGTSSDSSSVRAARTASSPTALSSTSDGDTPIQQPSSGPPSSVAHERRSRRMSHADPAGHRSKPSVSIAQRALSRPKLLVLDLDETLIHSTSRMGVSAGYSAVTSVGGDTSRLSTSGLKVRVVEVVLDGRSVVYHVYKRPWVDFFLRKVSAWYTVVIFTASMREYADPVIDWLDADGRGGMIATRLFRESCTYVNGSYVKDLRIVDPDLARVCLVDNSPISYAKDQANGIPIEGWINDPNDEALLDLLPMLDSLRFTNDVRHVLGLRLATTSTVLPEIDGTSAGNGSGVTKPRRQHRTSLTSLGPAELADLRSRR